MADDTGASAPASAAASSAAPTASTPAPAAASTPASATATPASSGSAAPEPGPIPYDRHKSILDGAYKERDAAQQTMREHQQKLEQLAWVSQFNDNPYPYVEQWLDQLAAHPQYQQQVLAKAARMLQSRRGAALPVEEPQPDVPIVDGNGQVTGQTYSAKQLKAWRDWDWQQKEAQLSERFRPLEEVRAVMEQQQAVAQVQRQANENATSVLGRLRETSPRFRENEPAIKKFFMEHEEFGDNVHLAYAAWLEQNALPAEQAKVLESLQTQANGATVQPGQTAASGRPDFSKAKDPWRSALEYYAEHPDEAAAMAHR